MSLNGFTFQVGNSTDAHTICVPQSVLDYCASLSGLLLPGCRIINADPDVFAIIIEYLQSCIMLGVADFSQSGQLEELTIHEDPLLNFAKAWHVGNMLRMPGLQNRLLQVYRVYYKECLQGQLRPVMKPAAFNYLMKNFGSGTKAEKFIIDFHAGLMQNDPKLKRNEFGMLPHNIQANIKTRWVELTGRGPRGRRDSAQHDPDNDRIAAGATSYMVMEADATHNDDFRVQYLYAGPYTSFGLKSAMRNPQTAAAGAIALDLPHRYTQSRNQASRGRVPSPVRRHNFTDAITGEHFQSYEDYLDPAILLPALESSLILPFLEPSTLQHARNMASSPYPSLTSLPSPPETPSERPQSPTGQLSPSRNP
jgi:hypothetical protein